MKTFTKKELQEILRLHVLWLSGDSLGKWADLREADLREADLRGADLREAVLREADLSRADLRGADLSRADLRGADLSRADLRGAVLSGAVLSGADLSGAVLSRAVLREADLSGADLRGADLSGADLRGAVLRGADLPYFAICPEEGSFVGWKKVAGNTILKLLVTGKRTSSLVGRKCRCSEAKVLEAIDTNEKVFRSKHNDEFIYTVGETVSEPAYNDDIREECMPGIHFFVTRKEAEEY